MTTPPPLPDLFVQQELLDEFTRIREMWRDRHQPEERPPLEQYYQGTTWHRYQQYLTEVTPQVPKQEEPPEPAMKVANPFLVGCDPEFAVVDSTGALINLVHEIGLGHDGAIGYDHGGWVAEFHPRPAKSAVTLLKRIQALVNSTSLNGLRQYKWRAGAMLRPSKGGRRKVTLGGHVHLDIWPYGPRAQDSYDYDPVHIRRMVALDKLTLALENQDILPKSESTARRFSGGYGMWSDWRVSSGSANPGQRQHMEYRTMASWLYSPEAALICLTGAKLAAVHPDGMKALPDLTKFFEQFQHADEDAALVLDKILGPRYEFNPDTDLKEAWRKLPC